MAYYLGMEDHFLKSKWKCHFYIQNFRKKNLVKTFLKYVFFSFQDINYVPGSRTARIPSSEHIITGIIDEDILVIFEDCKWQSNCTSHTSLSEIGFDGLSPIPTPERTIGCCGHLRSQPNTVPEEPPAFKHYAIRNKNSRITNVCLN